MSGLSGWGSYDRGEQFFHTALQPKWFRNEVWNDENKMINMRKKSPKLHFDPLATSIDLVAVLIKQRRRKVHISVTGMTRGRQIHLQQNQQQTFKIIDKICQNSIKTTIGLPYN